MWHKAEQQAVLKLVFSADDLNSLLVSCYKLPFSIKSHLPFTILYILCYGADNCTYKVVTVYKVFTEKKNDYRKERK